MRINFKRLYESLAEPSWVKDEDKWARAKKAAAKSDPEDLYALVTDIYKKMGGKIGKGKQADDPATAPTAPPVAATGEDKVRDVLVKNPRISGSTLLNHLNANGFEITPPGGTTEADAGSSMPQFLRPKKECSEIRFVAARLLERSAADDGIGHTKFKAVLIQEGLGNLKDRYYYTEAALKSAINVFEGKKIYADHPSVLDEQSRPERSVRDVLGHFENVTLEEGEDGRSMLTADVQLMDEQEYAWARGLMKHAIEYSKKFSDKDFVGLSINASGDAEELPLDTFMKETQIPESALPKLLKAKDEGIETIKRVNRIESAVSVDLVTEAGAGGRVLEMIEQEKIAMKKKGKLAEELKLTEAEEKKEETKETGHPAGSGGDKPKAAVEAAEKKESSEQEKPEGHDDEVQDKELIKRMMKKHLGDECGDGDDARAEEMYKCAKELGYEGEEAEKAAGYTLKMVKHMAKKAEAAETTESKESDETAEKKEAETTEASEKAEKKEESSKQAESEVIKLSAKVAMLEKRISEHDVEKHIDKRCKESGLPMSVTKKFRESIGEVKSTKDVDEKFKLFCEAFNAARGEAGELGGMVINVEKSVDYSRKVSFADCRHE